MTKNFAYLYGNQKEGGGGFLTPPPPPPTFKVMSFDCRFLADSDPEVSKGSAAGKEKMRAACESALAAGGIHISEGSKLWNVYRCHFVP